MNQAKKEAVTQLVILLICLGIAALVTIVVSSYALPYLSEYFEDNLNMIVMIGVSCMVPAFISKWLYTYACMKLRVFVLNVRFQVVDGILPILSDFKLNQIYLSMVTDYYLEDEEGNPKVEVSGLKRFMIANLGKFEIASSLLFFSVLVGGVIYFCASNTFGIFSIKQIMWLVILLLIYNTTITLKSIMLAITYKSMEEWIVSKNPIQFIIAPLILPILGGGYLIAVFFLGYLLNIAVHQPFLNIVSLFGVPILNPIITGLHAKFAVNDAKRTIDELRRQNGQPPQIW